MIYIYMAVQGYALISVPVEVQSELKARGWVRNSISYGVVISNAFKTIDRLENENTELKMRMKRYDDLQDKVSEIATGLVGSINGNK